MVKFGRIAIVGATVVAAQAFLGDIINGLFPTVTGFSVGFLSVGGIITAMLGVAVGEMIAERAKIK